MADINLIDVSLRDGNQSIWGATGLTTRMVEGVTSHLNDVGYSTIEYLSSTLMATAVRYHAEDPWERLRIAKANIPNAKLGFLTTGQRFISFSRTPDAVLELAFSLLARNGIERLWVVDPMNNIESVRRTAALGRKSGFTEVIGGICYAISPVHTDEYFANAATQLNASQDLDGVYLKDPAGILTPDRVRSLIPGLQSALTDVQLQEIHSHATTGLSPLTVLEAADLGVHTIHCALPPLADGASHPQAQQLVKNLHARGHTVNVNVDAMDAASKYLQRQAKIKNLEVGSPNQYDEAYYRHTIPGGVQSTTRRQLREIRQEHLFEEVIEEAIQVRKDLGWVIAVTPFSQYIVAQAALNVMTGERYQQVTNEVIDLLRGDFGPLPGEVDQNLLDKALGTQRGQETPSDTSELTIKDLRQKFGTEISDEELLLRAVMPTEQVDGMYDAKKNSRVSTLKTLLASAKNGKHTSIRVSNGTTRFSLNKEPA